MSAATARIEVRVPPQVKARIESAATLADTTLSSFVIAAATERADEIVGHYETHTSVPGELFDALIASLDEPAEINLALVKAARRSPARPAQL